MKRKLLSTRHMLYTTFWLFTIPALVLIILLTLHTIQRQTASDIQDYQNRLSLYSSTMERTLKNTENQLTAITALRTPFQAFHFCDTQLQKHNNAWELVGILKSLLIQEPLLGGTFLFSEDFSYYYPAYQINYPHSDQKIIRSFLTETPHSYSTDMDRWIPLELSDRTVLIRISGFETTICAFMIDPCLDENVSIVSSISEESGIFLFYSSKEGHTYTSRALLEPYDMTWDNSPLQKIKLDSVNYQLIKENVADYDLQINYLIPESGFFERLNFLQKLLLFIIITLLLLIPFMWNYLYRKLLAPLNSLSETMKAAGTGNFDLRADEDYPVLELHNLSQAFNRMLYDIQHLKLESYEKKLDLQQAQLQYLQLQIRPHFYLNCLKGLYGMAEKQQYHEIQETLLALSDYFRYIFRNNLSYVSLGDEIRSVSSYQKLQSLNFSRSFTLTMDIAADTVDTDILPLSILTFVENSVKHCPNSNALALHIKTSFVTTQDGTFLCIIISDNGGGFSSDTLRVLNSMNDSDFLYKDYNSGIYNIYYRYKLAYNGKAILAFYNKNGGGSVELYIPIERGQLT